MVFRGFFVVFRKGGLGQKGRNSKAAAKHTRKRLPELLDNSFSFETVSTVIPSGRQYRTTDESGTTCTLLPSGAFRCQRRGNWVKKLTEQVGKFRADGKWTKEQNRLLLGKIPRFIQKFMRSHKTSCLNLKCAQI